MTTRALERVDDWETRSYAGGYRGIHELAEQAFSGVVRTGTATLCLLNGNAVGVLDGTIEDFAEAEGTASVAPSPALPLLAVMQERSDEVRAKYYTEDTPLSKVDGTLADGGFTGFVELSENVLSGDYYVVYHGGRSMSVAFVGERGELLTEDEAFERADDEVGIYEVRPVDIDVIDVPEPDPEPESTSVAAMPGDSTTETETDGSATEDPLTPDADTAEETVTDDDGDGPVDGPGDRDVTAESPTPEENAANETVSTSDSERLSEDDETGGSAGSDDSPREAAAEPATDERIGADQGTTESGQSAGSNREDGGSQNGGTNQTTDAQSETTEATQTTDTRAETTEATQTADTRSETGESERTDASRRSTERSPATPSSESRSGGRTDTGDRQTDASASHPGAAAASSDRARETTAGRTRAGSVGDASNLEIRTIPSLDPAQSWEADEDGPQASTVPVPPVESGPSDTAGTRPSEDRSDDAPSGGRSSAPVEDQSTPADRSASDGRSTPESDEPDRGPGGTGEAAQRPAETSGATDDRVAALEETIDEREARIEDLEARVETVESKRAALETERDELETERDELREELSTVRSELESLTDERDALEAQLDGLDVGTEGIERRMSRREAIEGTNLFVRYGSKSEPTLAAARESGASQSDVRENLSVEYHTQFEVDGTLVEGHPFEAFLEGTMEHQFVTWVVTELLFEIRDTGHREELADLYDALPHVDRVELDGSVSVEFDEDGQTKRSQESFDVVFRDRMGNPLVVANVNDSRQAATENQLNSLVTAATRVGDTSDSLAGAMFVTSSFFEPAALETTAEATGGGLLSRDKRESFVKLSRKQGYHLCLVEARDDQFHMAVPEL